MKYKEFHRKIVAAGWKFDHAEGSHYFYITVSYQYLFPTMARRKFLSH